MVRINENFVVDVDDMNYTLKRDTHKTTFVKRKDENGNEVMAETPVYNTEAYLSNLKQCVIKARDLTIAEKLKSEEHPLDEAIRIISAVNEAFVEILERSMRENNG